MNKGTKSATLLGGLFAGGVVLGGVAYAFKLRPWLLHWGATEEEVQRALPGDDLVPEPKLACTQAITIEAPPSAVWPWLVQWGYERGGFYSYDWIDRLVGAAGVVSAERILPEFQHLEVGDMLPVMPEGGFTVVRIEPERALVLRWRLDMSNGQGVPFDAPLPERFIDGSWVWYLEPSGAGATRMLSRFHIDWNPSPQNALYFYAFLEPGSCFMDRGMLLGLKRRAER